MGESTFVLADIGGYTRFLNEVGLEHAREITQDLLGGVLKANRKRWEVAKLEGDCVFFHAPGHEPAEPLLEHALTLYQDFCRRVIDISSRAACPCGACTAANQLVLKFVVHSGEAAEQVIGGSRELIGRDVIVAHRLLKNNAPVGEYVLLTEAYLQGQTPPWPQPPHKRSESYDDVGELRVTYLDLAPARRQVEESQRIFVAEKDAGISVAVDIDAPPDVVWAAVNDPDVAVKCEPKMTRIEEHRSGRASGFGDVHTCYFEGAPPFVHVLVARDDENRRKTEKIFPSSLLRECYMTTEVEPRDGGSRYRINLASQPAKPVVSQVMMPLMKVMVKREMRASMMELKKHCEELAKVAP